jgi:chromosome segregation ATPase
MSNVEINSVVDKYNSLVTQYCQQADYIEVYIKTKQIEIETLQQDINEKQVDIDTLKEQYTAVKELFDTLKQDNHVKQGIINTLKEENRTRQLEMDMLKKEFKNKLLSSVQDSLKNTLANVLFTQLPVNNINSLLSESIQTPPAIIQMSETNTGPHRKPIDYIRSNKKEIPALEKINLIQLGKNTNKDVIYPNVFNSSIYLSSLRLKSFGNLRLIPTVSSIAL